jgi:hypothetical protein
MSSALSLSQATTCSRLCSTPPVLSEVRSYTHRDVSVSWPYCHSENLQGVRDRCSELEVSTYPESLLLRLEVIFAAACSHLLPATAVVSAASCTSLRANAYGNFEELLSRYRFLFSCCDVENFGVKESASRSGYFIFHMVTCCLSQSSRRLHCR